MWIRIMGIDPGLRHLGWGVIEVKGSSLRYLGSGTFHPDPDLDMHLRLAEIAQGVRAILTEQDPMEVAVEKTFVNANPKAALALGQARGAALAEIGASGRVFAEYAPNLIKKTVVGSGHAQKAQIRAMIGVLLPQAKPKTEDEADALAVAICRAQHRQLSTKLPEPEKKPARRSRQPTRFAS